MTNHFKTPKGTELPFLNLKGKNYLQVAYRIVWFREEYPNWVITSRIVERTDNNLVIIEANILDENGKMRSSAHKVGQFGVKFLEMAETGAIGRALAFLGFGTQFAEDLDEGDELADAPIQPSKPQPQTTPVRKLSEAQIKRLWAIAHKFKYSNEQVFEILRRYKVNDPVELSIQAYDEVCKYLEIKPPPQSKEEEIPF